VLGLSPQQIAMVEFVLARCAMCCRRFQVRGVPSVSGGRCMRLCRGVWSQRRVLVPSHQTSRPTAPRHLCRHGKLLPYTWSAL